MSSVTFRELSEYSTSIILNPWNENGDLNALLHSLQLILLFDIIIQLEVTLLAIRFNALQKIGEEPVKFKMRCVQHSF